MKDLLKRLKDENAHLLVHLGEKDEEIDRMKDEASQQEEVADNAHLESQLEEARRKEEVLRDRLVEKDKAYQMLESEVVQLRTKADQSVAHDKFKIYSYVLDEILESQRSPFDKTGLGYGKTNKETKEGPSCSLFAPSVPTHKKEEVRSEVKNKPYVAPRPQARFRREPTPKYDQRNRYDGTFHGYCFSCNGYGHRAVD